MRCKHLRALNGELNDLLASAREGSVNLEVLAFFWLEKRIQKCLTEFFERVLNDLGGRLLSMRAQSLGLFGELVD